MLICLLSAKGAPGVTSCAVGLARSWPRHCLLVEADLAGPSIFPGYLGGRAVQPGGVLGLAVAASRGELNDQLARLWEQTVQLPEPHPDPSRRRALLPGLTSPAEGAVLRDLWGPLASQLVALEASGTDVLVDLGRIATPSDARDPLLTLADLVCVVTRSGLPAATATVRLVEHRVGTADRDSTAWRTLVVGPGRPYSAGEISKTVGLVCAGQVAWDPSAALVLSDGAPEGGKFAASQLMRSTAVAATSIGQHAAARRERIGLGERGRV